MPRLQGEWAMAQLIVTAHRGRRPQAQSAAALRGGGVRQAAKVVGGHGYQVRRTMQSLQRGLGGDGHGCRTNEAATAARSGYRDGQR